jgi:hypothetical protein
MQPRSKQTFGTNQNKRLRVALIIPGQHRVPPASDFILGQKIHNIKTSQTVQFHHLENKKLLRPYRRLDSYVYIKRG